MWKVCFNSKQMFKKLFTNVIIRRILNTSKIEGDGMKILKGYVFRLYSDKNQEELIKLAIIPRSIIGIDLRIKDLSIRKWECPICHTNHDRDYNASVNIMFKGLEKYMLYLK